MSLNLVTRRVAVTGVATALAAGALVGGAITTATAAAGTTTYLCNTPVGPQPVDVTAILADLPGTLQAGQQVTETFSSPLSFLAGGDLAMALVGYEMSALDSEDFALPVGNSSIPVGSIALSGPPTAGEAPGTLVVGTSGTTEAFQAPAAGTYDVTLPEAFTLTPTLGAPINGPVDADCAAQGEPATLDSVQVLKNASATKAKPTKTAFKKGTAAKIKSTVTGETLTPAGKVVAKKGAKTYRATLNDNGVAVINLGTKLKPGKHKFAVKYLGSGYHKLSAAPKEIVVKVVR